MFEILLIAVGVYALYSFYKSLTKEQKEKFANMFNENNRESEKIEQYNFNNDFQKIDQPRDTLSLESCIAEVLEEKQTERKCPFCGITLNLDDTFCNICNVEIPKTEPKRQIKRKITTASGNELQIKSIATDRDFIRPYISTDNRISVHCSLNNYTVIDFETANMYPDSVCQMGIAVVENGEIVDKKSFLIRPPYNNFRNSHIHGIKLEDVENEQTFAELWDEIKPYIENRLVGAYNANFDIGCLISTLENYKIPIPNFAYFDILQNARESFKEYKQDGYLDNFKLTTLAKFFNIEYNAHDALNDVITAIQIQNNCEMEETFSFMYVNDDGSFDAMVNLLNGDEMFSILKEKVNVCESNNVEDYHDLIQMFDVAIKNGADEAKCLRYQGEIFEKCDLLNEALEKYQQAFNLNDKVGVKTKIKSLERALNK